MSTAPCPLGDAWHAWDVLNLGARSRSDVPQPPAPSTSACVRNLGAVPLAWRSPATYKYEHRSARRIHGDAVVERRHLHLDWVTMQAWGPGRGLVEVRITVDGILRGRAASGGCGLGGGGTTFPAVARVTERLAVMVTYGRALQPVLTLWELQSP